MRHVGRVTAWPFIVVCCFMLLVSIGFIGHHVHAQQAHNLPKYWDTPHSFKITGYLNPSEPEDGIEGDNPFFTSLKIVFHVTTTASPRKVISHSVTKPDDCFLLLNHDEQMPQEVDDLVVNDGYITIIYTRTNPTLFVTSVQVLCPEFIMQRPSDFDPPAHLYSWLSLDVNERGAGTSSMNLYITDAPSIQSQLYWIPSVSTSEPSTISQYAHSIGIDFIYTRPQLPLINSGPIPSSHQDPNVLITHPLFRFTGNSAHQSQESTLYDELSTFYNLIPLNSNDKIVNCIDQVDPLVATPMNSKVTFNLANLQNAIISYDGDLPSRAYSCSFTLHFPADALAAYFSSGDRTTDHILIETNGITIQQDPIQPPSQIPIRSDSTPSRQSSVMIWHSPHHQRSPTSFEFGVAVSSTFMNSDGILESFPAAQSMTLQLLIIGVHQGQPAVVEDQLNHMNNYHLKCFTHFDRDFNQIYKFTTQVPVVSLSSEHFKGFGLLCHASVTLQMESLEYGLFRVIVEDNPHRISIVNALDYVTDRQIVDHPPSPFSTTVGLPLYHVRDSIQNSTPVLVPIPVSFLIDDDGQQYGLARIAIHPLQHMPISTDRDQFYLHCIFTDLLSLHDVMPITRGEEFMIRITIMTPQQVIIYDNSVSARYSHSDFHDILSQPDPISSIFQQHQAIRSPSLVIPIPLHAPFDPTQPLLVDVKFPIHSSIADDLDHPLTIYPLVLPNYLSHMSVYEPQFARVTPIRSTPLTGYSYRCVTWDHMASLYVYQNSPTPMMITDENSTPCAAFIPTDLKNVDVSDAMIWKKREYTVITSANTLRDEPACFYELAAVCVTPSSSSSSPDGTTYDIHPLADCPLSSSDIHAVPCSLIDNGTEPQDWDYSLEFTAELTGDHPNSFAHYYIVVGWTYVGDPRLTGTLSVHAGRQSASPSSSIVLSRDIPLYVSPQNTSPEAGPVMRFTIPVFNSKPNIITVTLTTNGMVTISRVMYLDHTLQEVDGENTGCSSTSFKTFDSITHLCVCAPGYHSNVPTGLDNPLIHPTQFDCTSRCDESAGHHWDPSRLQCVDDNDVIQCQNHGITNPSTGQCVCANGYFGEYCQYDDADDVDYVCKQLECVAEHLVDDDDDDNECKLDMDDDNTSTVVCNCADGFTGDQCQHQAVCGVRQCVNGRLISPTGKPEECKCECNNDHITGTACNQCTLACRNGGVANTRCTACQCPAGYIGTTCTIPVWYHTFTLRNLPQHIVELILGTTASDKEAMAILQQTMVKYLLEDYSRVLSETFIVVDGNGNGSGGNDDDDNDDTRIRVRVELSQFQTIIPPANPNAPYVHIQLMLYPADMTEEMLAYALQHGLVFDWSRVTDNLEFFRKFLREQGIVDDDDDLTPDIDDPGCTTRECREQIIDEESSNHTLPLFNLTLATTLSMCLVAMLTLFYA